MGSVQCQQGNVADRTTDEGVKLACHSFQVYRPLPLLINLQSVINTIRCKEMGGCILTLLFDGCKCSAAFVPNQVECYKRFEYALI
eukprot:6188156-Pyramimonas_sp.AAC.3